MDDDANAISEDQLAARALQEDRAAREANSDVARLAHERLAERLRQVAEERRSRRARLSLFGSS